MLTGEIPTPHAYVFRPESGNRLTHLAAVLSPGGAVLRSPCLAYAIRHPSEGVILIDTGFHRNAAESLRKDFGALMAMVFRNLKPAKAPIDQQFRDLGIDHLDVGRVLITH